MKIIKKHWIAIVVCVVCAIVFFFIGMMIGKGTGARRAGMAGGFSASSTRTGGGRAGSGGGFASGQVSAIDSQSITLQLANGNSEVVLYSSSTQVIKPTTASMSDLAVGTQVMIGGTENSDGSLTAQSIQIGGTNGMGGRPTGAGSGVSRGQAAQ
jgi:hypothetical protein